jgi:hypothetical protein
VSMAATTLSGDFKDRCEIVRSLAIRFNKVEDFIREEFDAFSFAVSASKYVEDKFFLEITSHMDRGAAIRRTEGNIEKCLLRYKFNKQKSKEDKPGFMYNRICESPSVRREFYKVGITSFENIETRAKGFGLKSGWSTRPVQLVRFESIIDCRLVESHIKHEYRAYRYEIGKDGPSFMKSGMTEVFTNDVFTDWLESEHGRETLSGVDVTLKTMF